MYKGTDLVGKPVVTHDQGRVISDVKDVLFSAKSNKILGLLIDEGGLFATAKVIPFNRLSTIGPDSIIIENAEAVSEAREDLDINATIEGDNIARGTHIMSDAGEDMGKIVDVYFNQTTGIIEGYEVSGGIFADAYTGKSYLPAPSSFRIGEDVAFIPEETAGQMKEQVGGIKKAAQTTGEKLGQWTDSAGEKLQQAKDATISTAKEAGNSLKDKTMDAAGGISSNAKSFSMEQVKGKRVPETVRAKNGSIIAAEGQIVNDPVIERAKELNEAPALLAVFAKDMGSNAKEKAGDITAKAATTIEEGTTKAADFLGNAWDSLRGKAGEVRGQAVESIELRRIENALGLPVNRIILDKDDNRILEVGDIITNSAVKKAREAGVLNILLSSVGRFSSNN